MSQVLLVSFIVVIKNATLITVILQLINLFNFQLFNEKPGFEPQARHHNKIRKVFLRRFPLSRFLAKPQYIRIAMKSFSKYLSFGVDFKLQVPPLMYKNNTHNICGVKNQVNNSNMKGCNGQLCVYVCKLFQPDQSKKKDLCKLKLRCYQTKMCCYLNK